MPELDDDISTEDVTSDGLSAWTMSVVEQSGHVFEANDETRASQFDAGSIYSPSHHPGGRAVVYRVEHSVESEDSVEDGTV